MQGSILDQLKYRYRYGGASIKLIFWNTSIFLFFGLIAIFANLFEFRYDFEMFMAKYMYATTDLGEMLYRPWTIITHMFLHGGFWHILFNMLWLFLAGRLLEHIIGPKRFMFIYFGGGILGLILQTAVYNAPVYEGRISVMLGASAAVASVVIGAVAFSPNMIIRPFGLFNMRLLWLGVIFIGSDLLQLTSEDNVAHFAHLGGAIFGVVYATLYTNGRDMSAWFKFKNPFKLKKKMRVVSQKAAKKQNVEHNANKAERQKRIDNILDKIKDSGYDSLSKEEKEFLFNESKNV